MVLGFEGEKCEICGKYLGNEKTYKDVDLNGFTHNFCKDCYTSDVKSVEKILCKKINDGLDTGR